MTCARSQKKNGRNKRNVHKSRWLVLILLPLIGCAIALAYPTHAKKVEETREEKQETALKQAREDQAREYQAQEVMSDLVQSHPHPVIRNTLNQLIVGREVGLLLKPMAGILPHEASFIVMPDERGIMRDILNYPTEYLLDPRTSKQHKQLVIYHEWIHYEQQKDRRFPTWLAEGKVPIPFSDDMRQIWFESEMEASLAECKFAKEIMAENEIDYCQTYSKGGESALRKRLSPIYLTTTIKRVW